MREDALPAPREARNSPSALRPAYFALGILCVGLGYVGVVVPGMPTTVFMLVALWSFKRSSPRFERWLLEHRLFGPPLRDWERDRSIKRSTKIIAVSTLWVSIAISCAFFWSRPTVVGILLLIATLVSLFIATRKTKN
jgi:uncharacterized protein